LDNFYQDHQTAFNNVFIEFKSRFGRAGLHRLKVAFTDPRLNLGLEPLPGIDE
jgi:hypothetical protein